MLVPVTVVVLSYNRCDFVKDAVSSIQNQTCRPNEIFILDNFSTDGTAAYFKDLPDVVFIQNHSNLGVDVSYRKALTMGKNPYILIFHDDDVMASNMIEVLYEKIRADSKLVFVGSHVNFAKEPRTSFVAKLHEDWEYFESQSSFLQYLWTGAPMGFCTILFRREEVRTFDLDIKKFGKYFDRPFLAELINSGKTASISKSKLVDYRIHSGQDSKASSENEIFLINLHEFYTQKINKMGFRLCYYYHLIERLNGLSHAQKLSIKSNLTLAEISFAEFLNSVKLLKNWLCTKFIFILKRVRN